MSHGDGPGRAAHGPKLAGGRAVFIARSRPPPGFPSDLTPADHVVLSADVHWEGLSVGADLSGQVAEDPVISGCRLTGAAFVGAELIRARVNDTVFERCDLSGVILAHAVFTRVEFNDCRLSGADLSGAKLARRLIPRMSLGGRHFAHVVRRTGTVRTL